MLIISTNHDPVSSVLDGYSQALADWSSSLPNARTVAHIRSPMSIASKIEDELLGHTGRQFYFFGHGAKSGGFVGDDGAVAVPPASAALLQRRVVSATCCHGDQLGRLANLHGFSLFGYKGPLWVPTRPNHIAEMEAAVLAGPKVLMQQPALLDAQKTASAAYTQLALNLHKRHQPGDRAFAFFASMNAGNVSIW